MFVMLVQMLACANSDFLANQVGKAINLEMNAQNLNRITAATENLIDNSRLGLLAKRFLLEAK